MFETVGKQLRKPHGLFGRIIANMMIKGNSREYDCIIREMDIHPHDNLFEIGYGHGMGIYRICSMFDCKVSGIDFSALMFKMAHRRNREFVANNKAELMYGDFLDFKMPAALYDKIYCLNVVYFWNDLIVPFSNIRSGLKENGIFFFAMDHHNDLNNMRFTKNGIFNKYTIEEVTGELKKAAFSDISYTFDHVYLVKCRK